MKNPKSLARLAGVLYLALTLVGGWAQLAVRGSVYVHGDAALTQQHLVDNLALFRLSVAADILMATIFVALGIALYRLLAAEHARYATLLVVFVSVGAGSILLNLVFQVGSILVATDPEYLSAFGLDGRDGLTLLLLELHQNGYVLGGIFFGLWLLPLGLAAYRSSMFPQWFGVLVTVGSVVWLLDPVVAFGAPHAPEVIRGAISAVTTVAELAVVFFLLIVGVLRGDARAAEPAAR